MKTVDVVFQNREGEFDSHGRRYAYRTFIDVSLNDMVIVDTQFGIGIGMVVGDSEHPEFASKVIVSKLDMEEVRTNRNRNTGYNLRKEEIDRINDELDAKLSASNRMKMLEALSKEDASVKELLDKLKEMEIL